MLPPRVGLLGQNERHYPVLHQGRWQDKDSFGVALPIVILEVPYVAPYLDTWSDNYLESVALSQDVSDGIA